MMAGDTLLRTYSPEWLWQEFCRVQPPNPSFARESAQVKKGKQNKRKHNVAGRKEKQMQTHTLKSWLQVEGAPDTN